jgi:glycosyltransferase involved in cell wall biosynthesis
LKIALITDAWRPQVNGVVTTLVELVRGLEARGHEVALIEPSGFRGFPCPGYRELQLAWRPGAAVAARLDALDADAIHIATEGPLGSAARRHCLRRGWAFTTAFHTRFPEILAKALHIPEAWGYAWFRRFHAPAHRVMVPSQGMLGILQRHGFGRLSAWSHGVDLSLFTPSAEPSAALPGAQAPEPGIDANLPRPHFLHVGRLSYEKNLEAFLDLDLPGSKLVYGTGPLEASLKARYPQVHWRGVLPRAELPAVYASADAFVFPGRSETFGLVMLEALACGTPVAAYPVPGPLDVIGELHDGRHGGILHPDLREAALRVLQVPREQARARALQFDWGPVCEQFIGLLVPRRGGPAEAAG